MSNDSQTRGRELSVVLARAFPTAPPHWIAGYVRVLQSQATILQNLAVNDCNGVYDSDEAVELMEKKRDKARNVILRETEENFKGLTFEFGGDPRGCVVKMHVPGFPGDSWDDKHPWGVY